MAIARYKDLCIDSGPDETLGRFWAAALGLQFRADGEAGALEGTDPSQGVWMNVVPERKTVKHRVHLDVHCASVDELVERGASVLEPQAEHPERGWSVLADPEGGEFCAFVREPAELSDYRLYELVVDCARPRVVASWWADVLGADLGARVDQDWYWLENILGVPFEGWTFSPVPEPKTVKNRIHWDVLVDSVDDLTAAGATLLRGPAEDDAWSILADPEGNEFCAFVSGA